MWTAVMEEFEVVTVGKTDVVTVHQMDPLLWKLRQREDASFACDLPAMNGDLGFSVRLPGSGFEESGHFTPYPAPSPTLRFGD